MLTGLFILMMDMESINGGLTMAVLTKVTIAIAALGLIHGCSLTDVRGGQPSPTHRWVAQTDGSRAKYNFHNSQCAKEAAVEVGAARKSDPEFVAYERCMEQKGYTLATY